MKKLRNGRRGFTLLEMVIVIAIIVILSSAAVFGVATTLNRANAGQAELKAHNGNNFEAAARNKVKSYGANSVDWTSIPKYTPQNEALKEQKRLVVEDEYKDSEVTEIKYDVEGYHVVVDYNPELHHGLKDKETFEAWREEKNSYLAMGYLLSEIEAGTSYKDGTYTMNPVWEPKNHNDMTYEEYQEWLKNKDKPSGGATVEKHNAVSGSTVTPDSGENGILKYHDNPDGSVTLDCNCNNGNNNGSFMLRKNKDDTYSVYMYDNNYCVVGACGYEAWSDYGAKKNQWVVIPSTALQDLCTYYGITLNK